MSENAPCIFYGGAVWGLDLVGQQTMTGDEESQPRVMPEVEIRSQVAG